MTTPFSPGLLAGGLPDVALADLHHTANRAMASGLALQIGGEGGCYGVN